MKILERKIPAKEIMSLIDKRLERVTIEYNHAAANSDKIKADAMAETKWQIAELKMQFVDFLVDDLNC